jgi:hypothetical protein
MGYQTKKPANARPFVETVRSGFAKGMFALVLLSAALTGKAQSGVELRSISLSPSYVLGGATSTGTATLNQAAPSGGTTVTLASNNAAATVPASVSVAAGATTATFTVSTSAVGTNTRAKISGSVGSRTRESDLEITALSLTSVVITPSSVSGGTSASGVVNLNGAAPSGGTIVNLTSNTASATVPSTVTVAAGATSATFAIATTAVSSQTYAKVQATLGNRSQVGYLAVEPTVSFSVALAANSVGGGSYTTGTVTLASAAPSGGLQVKLSSDNSAVKVEQSIHIGSGKTTGQFDVLTTGVATTTTATITAAIGGVSETATLTVTPPALSGVSVENTTLGSGGSTHGSVQLSGRAPKGGIVVTLASSSTAATVPATVTVNQGESQASFKITVGTVTTATQVTITATSGSVTETATLTVSPLGLVSISARPSSVDGGHSSTGVVELNGPAGTGGVVITLASSDPSTTVPASITIAAGKSYGAFQITTTAVTLQTSVTLTATSGTQSVTATFIVNPVSLDGLEIHPGHVTGGGTSTGTVRLSGPAPAGGTVITLASNSATATVPATVTIPAGQNSVAFTITTSTVTANTSVQITASLGTERKTQNLNVTK